MSDYATLTDEELNKRIAQALGYRVLWTDRIHEYMKDYDDDDNPYLYSDPTMEGFVLFLPGVPDNEDFNEDTPHYETEAEAWVTLPNWVGHDYEAFKLLEQCPDYTIWKDTFKDKQGDIEVSYRVEIRRGFLESVIVSRYFISLPRAICEAWLTWKEATK